MYINFFIATLNEDEQITLYKEFPDRHYKTNNDNSLCKC